MSKQDTVQIYREWIPGYEDDALFSIVAESWECRGWTVESQGIEAARLSPHWKAVHANMANLTYEYGKGPRAEVMYHRWLAHHEGWATDYDVVNLGFTPADASAIRLNSHKHLERIFFIGEAFKANAWKWVRPPTPCYITAEGLENLLKAFSVIKMPKEFEYVDDQRLIDEVFWKWLADYWPVCAVYGEQNWHTAKLVHFMGSRIQKGQQWARNRAKAVSVALHKAGVLQRARGHG